MKPTKISSNRPMSNHIEEYFADATNGKEVLTSKELFKANPEDVDIKTDISIQEIVLINKLLFNNEILKEAGLKPVYKNFLNSYMRLKISLDRKSRGEFVDMNRSNQKPEDVLSTMSNVSNIMGAKK
jgi:hypothetical protein